MACSSCSNKLPSTKYIDNFVYEIIEEPDIDCGKTITDIQTLIVRLNCAKTKIHYRVFNQYMGFLQSMINLRKYCKYNVEPLITILESNGC